MTWQVLGGSDFILVTLFEATDMVDGGKIYLQRYMVMSGDELVSELRVSQAKETNNLCKTFVSESPEILELARVQTGEITYYQKCSHEDSKLNPDQTIRSQFNLFLVVDNEYILHGLR